MKIRQILAATSLVLLSGCTSAGLLILNTGLKLKSDHVVTGNVDYDEKSWQKLDVHHHRGESGKQRPVLIFFYGGSWEWGEKEKYFFVADAFARLGYVVVIPDYLKFPSARFPDFVVDGAAATAWVKRNIQEYGGDPDRIFIAGHSAGAHLGAMLLTDEQYLARHHLIPTDIKGFVGLAGPYNFVPDRPNTKTIFGPVEKYPLMRTENFVNGNEPPMLLLHGDADTTVGAHNQESLLASLKKVGNPSIGKLYRGVSHTGIVASLTPLLKRNTTTLEDMDAFFKNLYIN